MLLKGGHFQRSQKPFSSDSDLVEGSIEAPLVFHKDSKRAAFGRTCCGELPRGKQVPFCPRIELQGPERSSRNLVFYGFLGLVLDFLFFFKTHGYEKERVFQRPGCSILRANPKPVNLPCSDHGRGFYS